MRYGDDVVNALCSGRYTSRQTSLTQPFVSSKDKWSLLLPVRAIPALVASLSRLVTLPALTLMRIAVTTGINRCCPTATCPACFWGSWWHISPIKKPPEGGWFNERQSKPERFSLQKIYPTVCCLSLLPFRVLTNRHTPTGVTIIRLKRTIRVIGPARTGTNDFPLFSQINHPCSDS